MSIRYRGIRRVKDGLAQFLAEDLPVRAPELGAEWGVVVPIPVNDPEDPLKHAYFGYQPPALDRYPLLAITSIRTRRRRTEIDRDGDPEYATVHSLRLLAWVRAQGMEAADRDRDDLTAVIEWSLLDNQGMQIDGAECLILEDTIVSTYAEITPVKGERFLTAVQVDFDVRVDETIERPPLGTANDVRLYGESLPRSLAVDLQLPPHPALMD